MNTKWISKNALPASLHRLPGELGLHRDCPDVYLEQDWWQIKVMPLANFSTFMEWRPFPRELFSARDTRLLQCRGSKGRLGGFQGQGEGCGWKMGKNRFFGNLEIILQRQKPEKRKALHLDGTLGWFLCNSVHCSLGQGSQIKLNLLGTISKIRLFEGLMVGSFKKLGELTKHCK